MSLGSGARLGQYEVADSLGAGGMGEVYRGRDTRLNRDVAIKVLPDLFAADPERLARFEREAQVLASLNHPHIAQIYGLEESGSVRALIMELVDGETLADLMARGPVPTDQALPIARQIADALEAAHDAGIIHRDLKPANVKVRPDGTLKVLDFGLAKAFDPVTSAPQNTASNSPTITSPMMTGRGIILGTAAYMAPEQARGRAVDKRADIWAFGVVVYEMLTGKRAFEGDDPSDVLAAVLRQDIDWTKLPPSTSPSIRRLLERCLDRDPKQRLRDIGDARIEIDHALKAPAGARESGGTAPRRRWLVAAVVAAAVVAGIAGGMALRRPAAPVPLPVTRFSLEPPPGEFFRGPGRTLEVSRDGERIVFATNQGIYVRSLASLESRQILALKDVQTFAPTFSPDGRMVAVWAHREQAIKGIPLDGGAAVTLGSATAQMGGLFTGMGWGPDGIIAAHAQAGLVRYPAGGGPAEQVVRLGAGEAAVGAHTLPDGEHVLFTLVTRASLRQPGLGQVVVESLRTHERRTVVERGNDARYVPSGHIVYFVDGVLLALPFDATRMVATGKPVRMVEGIRYSSFPAATAQFSVSDTGTLIYVPGAATAAASRLDLALMDRQGAATSLDVPPGAYEAVRVAPDGRRAVFGSDDGKQANVWLHDLSGSSAPRRLTFGGRNKYPIWSPDGGRVAFQSDREGDAGIFWQRVDGGRAERLTKAESGASHVPEAWAENGVLLYTETKNGTVSLWTLSTRDGKREPFAGVESTTPTCAVFSPDGRWVAYATMASGASFSTVYVQPFPPTGATYQVSREDDGHHPVWSRDGKELFYIPGPGRLVVSRVTTQPGFDVSPPTDVPVGDFLSGPPSVVRNYDVLPDGRRFISITAAGDAESQTRGGRQINVVLNWFEELKAKVTR